MSGNSIRVAVSACLLGEEVRYNGGHSRERFVTDVLARQFELIPLCPEVDLGMGTPREPIRLVRGSEGSIRLVGSESGTDHTESMCSYADRKAAALCASKIHGAVLKKKSPSCGMERVKVYSESGVPAATGVGIFAERLMASMPALPVEEDGRLNDPRLRENFIERVFAHARVHDLFDGAWSVGDLVEFHTNEKMLLLAHDQATYRELGRIVGLAESLDPREIANRYLLRFMAALAKLATRKSHFNVLQHMSGHFKDRLSDAHKRELHAVIEDFRQGLIPLVVPITLIKHHVGTFEVEWLARQSYLDPHPKELMLRNHV